MPCGQLFPLPCFNYIHVKCFCYLLRLLLLYLHVQEGSTPFKEALAFMNDKLFFVPNDPMSHRLKHNVPNYQYAQQSLRNLDPTSLKYSTLQLRAKNSQIPRLSTKQGETRNLKRVFQTSWARARHELSTNFTS